MHRKRDVVVVAVVDVAVAVGAAVAVLDGETMPDSASFLINDIFKLCFDDSVRDEGANIGRG